MAEENKKKGLSPFTIVLAGIVVAVAITLPLGNRAVDQTKSATEELATEELIAEETANAPPDVVIDEADGILVNGVSVDLEQHPGALVVTQQIEIMQLELELIASQIELMQHKLDTIINRQEEVHSLPPEED